jgi:uncharacterized protein (DUF1501 family)
LAHWRAERRRTARLWDASPTIISTPAAAIQIVNIGTSRSPFEARSILRSFSTIRRASAATAPFPKRVLAQFGDDTPNDANAALDFLARTARNAADSSDFVRQASSAYRTPVDYGIGGAFGGGLQRVAALIAAGMKTRLYYVTYPGNAFDTHVQQGDVHARLLMYTADAVRAFLDDVTRLGRGNDVAVMMFTEFGRRVEENGSLGTDHGTAGPMFLFGKHDRIKGGFYGRPPSLTDLDDGNLKMTTDFRSVYATAIKEWLGYDDTDVVLKGRFDSLGAFA